MAFNKGMQFSFDIRQVRSRCETIGRAMGKAFDLRRRSCACPCPERAVIDFPLGFEVGDLNDDKFDLYSYMIIRAQFPLHHQHEARLNVTPVLKPVTQTTCHA